MSIDRIAGVLAQARAAAGRPAADGATGSERLKQVAAEFESMLLLKMLREMREAGSWNDEDDEGGLGAETLFETLDVELANHLSRVQGFGLGRQLIESIEPRPVSDFRPLETARTVPERTPSTAQVAHEPLSIPSGAVTSDFGWRRDPFSGAARFHRGIDVRAAYGQDIQTAAAGRVVFAGAQGGYGNTVVVEHEGGVRTRYAHLSETTVTAGEQIAAGQVVGRAGNSGRATATHLHFEVISGGGPVDPRSAVARLKPDAVLADSTNGRTQRSQEIRGHDDEN